MSDEGADDAWDMPQLNWLQQGSFEQGTIPPVAEATDPPQVWLGPISQTWLPWVCGALDQLRNPSAWIVSSDASMANTLRRCGDLLGLLCANGGSQMPVELRLQDCVLQSSSDGGTTWVDVPGWSDNFGDCVRNNLPPPPPLIGPTPVEQRACNIAGYLATRIIEQGLTAGMDGWSSSQQVLDFAANISQAILAEALPWTNLFVQACDDVFAIISTSNIGALRTAMGDPALWGLVTCAIYNAIKDDGQVSPGNYAAIVSNVCGISYSPSVAVTAVCNFVTGVGAVNLMHWQVTGALDIVDCTDCGTFCHRFDFTTGTQGWAVVGGYGGIYTPGVGFQSSAGTQPEEIVLELAISPGITVTDANLTFCTNYSAPIADDRKWVNFGGAGGPWPIDLAAVPSCTHSSTGAIAVSSTAWGLVLRNVNPGELITVSDIEISGLGPDPFGPGPCTY